MKSKIHPTSSIAVLPFHNISPDQNLNYFALGFAEDLITDLSRFSSLQVISSHSSGAMVDENLKEDDLVSTLKADYLVKGSYRQKGNDLRINTQLVLTREGTIVWSHRYEADIYSLFEIQDDITEQLVSALQREIDINLLASTQYKPRTSLAAYEYWLMGMEELRKGNLESDNNARELFQQALAIDPNYSRAYAGLSLSYFNEWSCQFWERWDYSQKGAFEYAIKAVELDDTNYISMTVLGRLYIYKGEWERAEHFLRKSLRLNPNDTDNLIQIASCFVYLGYLTEAENLYLKAMRLNPINTDWYFSFGAMLYFEKGEYQKCVELGLKTDLNKVMVDMSAFISGAYYYLKDYANMKVFWNKYLELFQLKILRGNTLMEEEALKWVRNVNPHKVKTNLIPFLHYLANQEDLSIDLVSNMQKEGTEAESIFRKTGALWQMNYEGSEVLMPEVKGYHDISKLISNPNQEIHCLELMGVPVSVGHSEVMIDEKAKKEYRSRLARLQGDIDEAQTMNDQVRAAHLQEEYDKLVDHLSTSLGLGGKSRMLSDQVDKTRSAVTWRIRSAIKKIAESHSSLGNHLSKSIKTGTFCNYSPEKPVIWDTE